MSKVLSSISLLSLIMAGAGYCFIFSMYWSAGLFVLWLPYLLIELRDNCREIELAYAIKVYNRPMWILGCTSKEDEVGTAAKTPLAILLLRDEECKIFVIIIGFFYFGLKWRDEARVDKQEETSEGN